MLNHQLAVPCPPRRVVVIGGSGFVGHAVVQRVAAAGIEVLSIGRADFDLQDPSSSTGIARLLRPTDAVVFSAARAPCRDLAMLVENVAIVRTVLAALTEAPVAHVVNISSDAVYGDEAVPITEASAAAPTTFHGVMHLAREIALKDGVRGPLNILRPTLIYGAHDPHNGYGPNRFRRVAAKNEDIVLFGAGEERRDHVLIDDLAEIVLRVLMHRSTGVLNVATGEIHSFQAIAELALAVTGSAAAIRTSPRIGPMPHNGYRAFDPAATAAAFPDFKYASLPHSLPRVHAEATRAEQGSAHG
jgi:nucleoside-diphosphate-sugar epimerase